MLVDPQRSHHFANVAELDIFVRRKRGEYSSPVANNKKVRRWPDRVASGALFQKF